MLDNWDYKSFTFGKGAHETREDGMCITEATAYVAGEPHSDMPKCASPVLCRFFQGLNDATPGKFRGQFLGEFVFRLIGTVDSSLEGRRFGKIREFADKAIVWPAVFYQAAMVIGHSRFVDNLAAANRMGLAISFQATVNNRWPEVLAFLDELVGMTEVKEPGIVPNKTVEVANVG